MIMITLMCITVFLSLLIPQSICDVLLFSCKGSFTNDISLEGEGIGQKLDMLTKTKFWLTSFVNDPCILYFYWIAFVCVFFNISNQLGMHIMYLDNLIDWCVCFNAIKNILCIVHLTKHVCKYVYKLSFLSLK